MGLKTNNFVSKQFGETLTTAYAILSNLIIEKDSSARAIFVIQKTREQAETLSPYEKVEIRFKWDRKVNPVEKAYELARTEIKEVEVYTNGEVVVEKVNGLLYGWDNDFVGE